MRSILYLIAVILVIGWLLGVFVYSAGGLIHILIVVAVIALLLGLIRRAWPEANKATLIKIATGYCSFFYFAYVRE